MQATQNSTEAPAIPSTSGEFNSELIDINLDVFEVSNIVHILFNFKSFPTFLF